MGIFSKIMAMTNSADHKYTVDSEQEAWLGILYTIIAADGEIKDIEIDELCDRLQHKTFFKNVDVTDLYHVANQAYQKHGGKTLIDKCSEKISSENRATVLTIAIDLMLVDGHEDEEEKKFIHYLAEKLSLQSNTSDQIVEVLNWRNKYNKFS
tara:strand:+ start:92393 stop:92851 length:459 start_codon:yes stop_codon:yes gene_type:complete